MRGGRTNAAEETGDDEPHLQPVSVELYAMCSDAVAAALDAPHSGDLKLAFRDWRSGPHKRMVQKATLPAEATH